MTDMLKNWLDSNGFDATNMEAVGENGSTALLIAARKGEADVVSELIALGADVNEKNNDGNNTLWNGVYAQNETIIRALVDAGIDKDNRNDNGATALMYAASNALDEMVELLLSLGCDKNIQNFDDYTALDLASTPKILKLLR